MIEVTDVALRQAAGEGMDAFIGVFTGAYKKEIGGEMTAGTMSLLTGEQHTLLAYQIFRDEVMEGGFCQLIQNGYGGYIFDNPFAKVVAWNNLPKNQLHPSKNFLSKKNWNLKNWKKKLPASRLKKSCWK